MGKITLFVQWKNFIWVLKHDVDYWNVESSCTIGWYLSVQHFNVFMLLFCFISVSYVMYLICHMWYHLNEHKLIYNCWTLLLMFTAVLITSSAQQFISLCLKCVDRIEKLSQQLLTVRHPAGDWAWMYCNLTSFNLHSPKPPVSVYYDKRQPQCICTACR